MKPKALDRYASNDNLAPCAPIPIALDALDGLARKGADSILRDQGARAPLGGERVRPCDPVQSPSEVVIEDGAMVRLYQLVGVVARSAIPALVLGETGVGKEIVSTALHARSLRAARPLVRINCAAFPESLLESELLGFERGAFTGALQGKPGLIESADGGSFLLDEIGEMPLATQAKLLRVLESGEVMRLGALKQRLVDVRFIAATNRELATLVAQGRLRRDLYYRLNGITLRIPPLRERPSEIPALAIHFLSSAAKNASRRGVPSLSPEALALLEQHRWPGNVRELKNVMERAVVVCDGDIVTREHIFLDPDLPEGVDVEPAAAPSRAPRPRTERRGRLLRMDPETERSLIERALSACGGHQGRAAELLGVSRRTLVNRLNRLGIARSRRKDLPSPTR
jgi:transcriptional regulator with PAS, ATPase and Fis domain